MTIGSSPTEPLDLAVIGARTVGAVLARAWAGAGHRVTIGVRHPDAPEVAALAAELGAACTATTPAAAIAGATVVICAIPGSAMAGFVAEHAPALGGRIVIDATNDLSEGAHDPSAIGDLARLAPTALAYRAFNSVGWENLTNPMFGAVRADLFFAGPDGAGRGTVARLIADAGPRPVYVGAGDDAHRAVDALATLWFCLAFGQGWGRRLAFRALSAADG